MTLYGPLSALQPGRSFCAISECPQCKLACNLRAERTDTERACSRSVRSHRVGVSLLDLVSLWDIVFLNKSCILWFAGKKGDYKIVKSAERERK
jgi:hypothetical protein